MSIYNFSFWACTSQSQSTSQLILIVSFFLQRFQIFQLPYNITPLRLLQGSPQHYSMQHKATVQPSLNPSKPRLRLSLTADPHPGYPTTRLKRNITFYPLPLLDTVSHYLFSNYAKLLPPAICIILHLCSLDRKPQDLQCPDATDAIYVIQIKTVWPPVHPRQPINWLLRSALSLPPFSCFGDEKWQNFILPNFCGFGRIWQNGWKW